MCSSHVGLPPWEESRRMTRAGRSSQAEQTHPPLVIFLTSGARAGPRTYHRVADPRWWPSRSGSPAASRSSRERRAAPLGSVPRMPPTVFAGGRGGAWRVESIEAVTGGPLPAVPRLAVLDRTDVAEPGVIWALRRVINNARYSRPDEQEALARQQPDWAARTPPEPR